MYTPSTAEEYINIVRALGAIAETALNHFIPEEAVSDAERSKSLARIAEMVEVISSLRGDSGIFDNTRPEGLIKYQKEMYTIEDNVRQQLIAKGYQYPRM